MFKSKRSIPKGISPLISVVLLIAFTLAVSAILVAWFTSFTADTTDSVGNESERLIDCSLMELDITGVGWDLTNQEVSVIIENRGTTATEEVIATVHERNGSIHSANISNLDVGQTNSVRLKPNDIYNVDEIFVLSEKCPEARTKREVSQAEPVTDGLVSWWSFNEKYRNTTHVFDAESAGSGRLLDNNVSNDDGDTAPDYAPGAVSDGVELDGVDDLVNVSQDSFSDDPLNFSGTFTLSLWYKSNEAFKVGGSVENRTQWAGRRGHYVMRHDNREDRCDIGSPGPNIHIRFNNSNYYGTGFCRSDNLPSENEWHHYVGFYNRTAQAVEFWVDGEKFSQTSVDPNIKPSPAENVRNDLLLGGASSYSSNGTLDEVMIYDRMLSEREIRQNYEAGLTRVER